MSFEGIVQIENKDTTAEVNQQLTQGWELLAITPSNDGLVYTIGRRATKKTSSEILRDSGL
ncbi:hypothetical protein [Pseudomonas extremorientalis]|uniref:DUF4177 domain-containing protein n=1 Tax=Pseudomonas extremorientalis TaxID=169669 RepID=A0A1H0KRX6_9PSED|nr:hypothetical protein [Pseudomonas extremorientalis]KAB0517572.1 hypothetical protein F7R08_18310 [Pseudomonas extremorientalis]OIN05004.1 hypothetical protein BFN10_24120 [Pseudomonas extremorientalis]SDO58708.1 hypothetical protein SAMN04490184_0925 [Pseudomonas extremorientalis]